MKRNDRYPCHNFYLCDTIKGNESIYSCKSEKLTSALCHQKWTHLPILNGEITSHH